MNFTLLICIAAIVAAGITLLVLGFGTSKSSRSGKQLAERVHSYAGSNGLPEAPPPPSLLARVRQQTETRTAAILEEKGWHAKLTSGIAAAGLTLRPEEFVMLTGFIGIVGGICMFLFGGGSVAAAVLGFAIGVAAPSIFLRLKASRRQAKFVEELPGFLTALASSLSAGSSLPQALEAIAEESSGPIADELNRAVIEARLGTSIPDALEAAAMRMHCDDLEMVVMAIRLQSTHGGNLADLLNTVSATLRERVEMQRHVKALSAEGRISLMVLMALPVGMLAFMAVIRREYFMFFVGTTAGLMMLGACALMMLLGFLWAKSIVAVEV